MSALTHPDLISAVNILAQTTEKSFSPEKTKAVNKLVKRALQFAHFGVSYPHIGLETLHLVVFSDSSFTTNGDSSSQLGFTVLLVDGSGNACVVLFASSKSKRVFRSVLGAEIFAFADGADEALILMHDLRYMLKEEVPLKALTDSSSLFSIIIRSTSITERRLMIYLQAAREAFDRSDIAEIGWIERARNISYSLTKPAPCDSMLQFMAGHHL